MSHRRALPLPPQLWSHARRGSFWPDVWRGRWLVLAYLVFLTTATALGCGAGIYVHGPADELSLPLIGVSSLLGALVGALLGAARVRWIWSAIVVAGSMFLGGEFNRELRQTFDFLTNQVLVSAIFGAGALLGAQALFRRGLVLVAAAPSMLWLVVGVAAITNKSSSSRFWGERNETAFWEPSVALLLQVGVVGVLLLLAAQEHYFGATWRDRTGVPRVVETALRHTATPGGAGSVVVPAFGVVLLALTAIVAVPRLGSPVSDADELALDQAIEELARKHDDLLDEEDLDSAEAMPRTVAELEKARDELLAQPDVLKQFSDEELEKLAQEYYAALEQAKQREALEAEMQELRKQQRREERKRQKRERPRFEEREERIAPEEWRDGFVVATRKALWSLLAVGVLLLFVALLRPIRRAIAVQHLLRPLFPLSPSRRAMNLMRYMRIAIADAGHAPQPSEPLVTLATRVESERVARGDAPLPALKQAAELYQRMRFGLGIPKGSIAELGRLVRSVKAALHVGAVERVRTWWRPLGE